MYDSHPPDRSVNEGSIMEFLKPRVAPRASRLVPRASRLAPRASRLATRVPRPAPHACTRQQCNHNVCLGFAFTDDSSLGLSVEIQKWNVCVGVVIILSGGRPKEEHLQQDEECGAHQDPHLHAQNERAQTAHDAQSAQLQKSPEGTATRTRSG